MKRIHIVVNVDEDDILATQNIILGEYLMSRAHDTEIRRLQFLIKRDGYRAASEFALRALRMYRKMILDEKSRVTDRAMVDSYLTLKEFYFRTHPFLTTKFSNHPII